MGNDSINHTYVRKPHSKTVDTEAQVSFRLGDSPWVLSHREARRDIRAEDKEICAHGTS